MNQHQIKKSLKALPDWKLATNKKEIHAEYVLKNFLEGVRVIRKIAEQAEKMDHHPDIHLVGYRKLNIQLTTHSEGGLTQKDFELASKISCLPKKFKSVV